MTDKSIATPRRRRMTPARLGRRFLLGSLVLLCLGAVDSVVFPLLALAAFVLGWTLIFGGMNLPARMWPLINRDAQTIERYLVTRPSETREFRYRPFGCLVVGVLVGCSLMILALGVGALFVTGVDWRGKITLGAMLILLALWMAVYFLRLPRALISTSPDGIYFRGAFIETTIRWDDVTALESSDIRVVGNGVFTSLLRVHTPERYVRIETKIMEFDELRDIIQQATGLDWK